MSDDEQIRQLLSDAVSDVEPHDRIAQIRASVHPDPTVVPMSHARSWGYAVAGIAATAAVIGVVAYVASVAGDDSTELGPTAQGGSGPHHQTTAIATDTAVPSRSGDASDAPARAAAVYYLGASPRGTVLYREFSRVTPSITPLEAAVDGLMAAPLDPDYRTAWKAGWLETASSADGLVQVELGNAPAHRPSSMSARDASEAVQQVVYTVQAALQQHDPVQFTRKGLPVTSVLGVSTTVPVAPGQAAKVLSLVNVTDPVDGAHLDRGRLVVTGVASAPEVTVVVRLERRGTTYRTKPGTAVGASDPDQPFPWKATLDTTGLAPGRYLLVASDGDGKGGDKVDQDTRTVYLK
jgi:Sporulation and spore germination/Immunoglobulin-like domain of bacterial spore germination